MKTEDIEKIFVQCKAEIDHERNLKKKRIDEVALNEDIINSVKPSSTDSRANFSLGRGDEFLETYLSKIISPLTFKFTKKKDSQMQEVILMNALKDTDKTKGQWDRKDRFSKVQAITYGRAIQFYCATTANGKYKSILENIDFYDFLIDSDAGGEDIEKAYYMGNYNVVIPRKDLIEGAKKGIYLKEPVARLLEGTNNQTLTIEEQYKMRRDTDLGKIVKLPTKEKYKFWRWFTTYEGERYYCILDNDGTGIRCELMKEAFSGTEDCPQGCYPYTTWATRDDMTVFWSKSPIDAIRELIYGENISINQMMDNSEQVNNPQKAVQVENIKNMAELKYNRKNLHILVKGDVDINKAYKPMVTPPIDTPIKVYDILESILQKASGVTDATAGVADEDGKVGIYEGNVQAIADRFRLIRDRYRDSYQRLGMLYQLGVKTNLSTKQAVEIIGEDGVEVKKISRRDLFKKGDDFLIKVESADSEATKGAIEQRTKIQFLERNILNAVQNQKKAYELGARAAGFTEDETKSLLDTSEYGDAKLMSECSRDIEDIIGGKEVKPNRRANNAYKKKIVDYMEDQAEKIDSNQFKMLQDYVLKITPIVTKNEAKDLMIKQQALPPVQGGVQAGVSNPVPQEEQQLT